MSPKERFKSKFLNIQTFYCYHCGHRGYLSTSKGFLKKAALSALSIIALISVFSYLSSFRNDNPYGDYAEAAKIDQTLDPILQLSSERLKPVEVKRTSTVIAASNTTAQQARPASTRSKRINPARFKAKQNLDLRLGSIPNAWRAPIRSDSFSSTLAALSKPIKSLPIAQTTVLKPVQTSTSTTVPILKRTPRPKFKLIEDQFKPNKFIMVPVKNS